MNQPGLVFHGYFRSSSSYRCRIAFNLKGIAPETRAVHLLKDGGEQKSEAFRALNPQMLVPAIETGDGVLTQSPAILEWLDEVWPDPPLLPAEPFARAEVRAFAAIIGCDIHPLHNLRVLDHLRGRFGQDQAGVEAWCRRWIGDGLAACEALVQRRAATRFAFGAAPGMAEVYLVPQLFAARRFDLDLAAFPRLGAIDAACAGITAFAEAHPSRQPDAAS